MRYGAAGQFVTARFSESVACTNAVFGDPLYGTRKGCAYEPDAESAPAAPAMPPAPPATRPIALLDPRASGGNPPVIFNASASARAGQVVSLQGADFGTAPRVTLDGGSGQPLEIVNRVGTGWLAVRLPADAAGALGLRIANDSGTSEVVRLNAARPLHLDTLQLVPQGAFRVFGRNLLLAGSTPRVTVDGAAATIDLGRSDEHMLVATAPAGLAPTSAASVVVDNGNGSGPATLDRTIEVANAGRGDPFGLGVGWAAAFSEFAANVVDARTDARLQTRVACNGNQDDAPAMQRAIDLAASNGGGVVQLPAGRCRLAGGLALKSRVVLQGAGKSATELVYESNYPVAGQNIDLAGVRNLTLTNSGASTEGPLLKNSTRVVLQNLRIRLMTSRQMFLTGNRQFAVVSSDFEQTGSFSHQGPYTFEESAGFTFVGNSTRSVDGAPTFGRIHDAYLAGNRFTRDLALGDASGTVHAMTLDFAYRVAVVGNRFDVAGGPVTNITRNDGETILTEGGGANRTENLGNVSSATGNTLSDPSNTIRTDPFSAGSIPENYGVAIVAGKGAGQTRRVVAYHQPTLTIDRAWAVVPDSTSRYATFVWGLEKSLIKANKLSQNPRGIWLYHTAIREVDVIGNDISEGGGIYLRSYQNLATRSFTPIYNVLLAGNKVANSNGRWTSYINSVFVNADAKAFGIATIGVEMRANEITANRPNVSSAWEEYAGTEGYVNMMRVENYNGYESSPVPRLLGSLLADNVCRYCDVAVRIGTGAGGSTILNTRLIDSASAVDDWATTSTPEKSIDTVIR